MGSDNRPPIAIGHVTLRVADVARATAFYAELGLRPVMENPSMGKEKLRGGSFEDWFKLNVLLSTRLDEGTLARFWGSLNQPIRPALQA